MVNFKLFCLILQRAFSNEDITMDDTLASDVSEAASTDQDQDDSLDMCSSSSTDDLNMNDEEMRLFDTQNQLARQPNKTLTKADRAANANPNQTTSSLHNPGSMISDFYISNMNYAMRYSVEYVQQVASDIRSRRQRQDSMACANERARRHIGLGAAAAEPSEQSRATSRQRQQRSSSVDRLYAVRREHLRYIMELFGLNCLTLVRL